MNQKSDQNTPPLIKNPRYFAQFRPDSDLVHKTLRPEVESLEAWIQGNEANNFYDMTRFYMIFQNLTHILENNIEGAIAELGVWRGNSAKVIHQTAPNKKLYLFDTFQGFDERDVSAEKQAIPVNDRAFKDTSKDGVKTFINGNDNIIFCEGWFPETTSEVAEDEKFCFVHVDCDLGKPVTAALEFFYPRLAPGALMLIHDYSSGWWKDVKPAVDEFMKDKAENIMLMPDKSGSVAFVKNG